MQQAATRPSPPVTPAGRFSELRYVPVFAAAVLAVWAVPVLGTAMFAVLAVWAVRSDRRAVEAVTFAWLVSSLNPEIYVYPSAGLRWLVLLAAAGGLIVRRGPRTLSRWFERYPSLLVFSILVVLTSVLSDFPGLSMSKLVGFLVGVFVVLMLFQSKDIAPPWLNQWLISLGVAVVIVSIPLLFTPLGYVRNGRGFQGILNHPQALGVFLAPFVAYFGARFLTGTVVLRYLALASGFGVMLILTQARTGALAAAAGVAVAVAVALVRSKRSGDTLSRSRVLASVIGLFLLSFVAVAWGAADDVSGFLTKGRADSLAESFEISRGSLVDDSLERFGESPLIGSGFGVSADLDPRSIQVVLGIPVGSPVESGFAVVGLLEQLGLLGAVAFLVFLARVVAPAFRAGLPVAAGLVTGAIASNFGEATITSFGGMGLLVWLTIGWGIAMAVARPLPP